MPRLAESRAEPERLHDSQGMTYPQVSQNMEVTAERAHQLHANAFRDFCFDHMLRKKLDEKIHFYARKSMTAYLSDWKSVAEEAALWGIGRARRFYGHLFRGSYDPISM